jgi:nitrate reductase NapAB chaperone NapD
MATPHLDEALEELEAAAKELAEAAMSEIVVQSERADWLEFAARAARLANDVLEASIVHQHMEENTRERGATRTHD